MAQVLDCSVEDLISEVDFSELKPSELRSDELRMQKRMLAEWKENTRRERVTCFGVSFGRRRVGDGRNPLDEGRQDGETMRVKIDMQTRQTIDGDTDIMEHSAEGILRDLSEGQHVLTYFQDGIHNEMRIDVSGEEIIVTRNWKQENQFHYKQNKHHIMNYETPMGMMELGFDTKYVEIDRIHRDCLMEIRLVYTITQGGQPVSDNEVRIRISER